VEINSLFANHKCRNLGALGPDVKVEELPQGDNYARTHTEREKEKSKEGQREAPYERAS